MAGIKSSEQFVNDFFNLKRSQNEAATLSARPTSHQERLERMSWRQRLALLAVGTVVALGAVEVASNALDHTADRQSPPAGFDTDHTPSAEEAVNNAGSVTDEAELSEIVEAADPRP